ncbi:MAG: D-glycero-beta-D-manno-heptose 1-phosphate adenylyltransferase [Chitinophagia bacterium]|nr:D-glycero-beta-D-manno-heptose 1-phosphate adenylyltransferase [Chitinophagia bacterium]
MEKIDWIKNKIKTLPELSALRHTWKTLSKQVVFTNGCFDILHHGHLDLLAKAANCGNLLIVGINSDASVKRLKGPERPINTEQDRAFQIASLLCVDAVFIFDEDTPLESIEALQPDTLVKGGDYSIATIVGAQETMVRGGKVEIIPFVEGYSTTSIIKKIQGL